MRRYVFGALILLLSVSVFAQQTKNTQQKNKSKVYVLKTDEDKMSYLSGYDLGLKVNSNIKSNNFPLRKAAFLAGIQEALDGLENRLTPEEIQYCIDTFKKMSPQAENQKKLDELTMKYKNEGEDFLALNGRKDSVKTTSSGLQYKVLREGTGKSPAETSMVTVHYRGRLISGVVFDESYSRGEPTSFKLNQVIKGWTEGLQLMKEGSKYELFIPNKLAYGEQPAGQLIPPGSMLIFEVELISVQ